MKYKIGDKVRVILEEDICTGMEGLISYWRDLTEEEVDPRLPFPYMVDGEGPFGEDELEAVE